jgi:hypothetical protein
VQEFFFILSYQFFLLMILFHFFLQLERVRWGCVSSYTTLKRNEVALNRLIEAMASGASIPQCIQVLEESPREL